MKLKFDIRFKFISRILMSQLTYYLETSSNNPLICLISEGKLTLQRFVANVDLYIDSMQQGGLTICDIVNFKRNSVAVCEGFMKLFVCLFDYFIQLFNTRQK